MSTLQRKYGSEIEMVRHHVQKGLETVERQRKLVAEREERGRDATQSRRLLANFEAMQEQHEAHLERLERGKKGGSF